MLQSLTYRWNHYTNRVSYVLRGLASFVALSSRKNDHPSVALVMVGRNDDYMPDFAQRLHATITWNVRHLADEIIFVEWNPPADRELLAVNLTREFACLRAYVVPPTTHQAICQNAHLPLLEYHAKNVGIRRARSPWIIATNADVALGISAIRKIRRMPLDKDVAWTAQRIDIPWTERSSGPIGLKQFMFYRRISPYDKLGTGDFLMASRDLWERAGGYDESLTKHRIGCDIRGTAQLLAHGATIRRVGSVLHLAHPTSCSEGVKPHHGEHASLEGVPYQNGSAWGLGGFKEIPIGERIWQLES
jgi:hypothetical protein